jgi:hypothetical protein
MKSYLKPPKEERNGFKDKERLAKIHDLPCVVCFTKGIEQKTKTIAHHKIGNGLGLKASDRLTIALCEYHHNKSINAIHNIPLWLWEEKFGTQEELIELTSKLLQNL